MTYKVLILSKANDDLTWFRKSDKQSYLKCFDIVRDIMSNPRIGIAKPERLKYFEQEVWSRRVNDVDRVIYTIYDAENEVEISSFKGHYE